MIYALALTFILAVIGAIEGYYLVKRKLYRELIVSFAIIALTVFYIFNEFLDWNFPEPGKLVTLIFKPLSRYVFGYKFTP